MFNNLEELKAEILKGKTNEEIIQERLAYLNSPEYKSKRMPAIIHGEEGRIFHDGFIDENEIIGWGAYIGEGGLYRMDIVTFYQELIEYVRNNMNLNGVSIKNIINGVRNYYNKSDENSKYYELAIFLKNMKPNNTYFARSVLPNIISAYNHSNQSISLMEFAMGYLHKKGYEIDLPNIAELETRYVESCQCDKYEEWDGIRDVIIPLSDLKGTGIAACTEYSVLTQNAFAFLGYDAYMIGGHLTIKNKTEGHNFNVIKSSNGKYVIVDSSQFAYGSVEKASCVEDIRNIQNVEVKRHTKDAIVLKYTADEDIRTKTPLEQREAELAALEAESRKYDEAEALIGKLEQRQGEDIGE